uniref:Uncharacterized protein n=1 Tax=Trypanosoma congolense (strain IL3000) TaxID=1068625 RepID=G0UTJ8_TRYCI|nr:conserved hypothetical protein [Trypanosoma congolense IL3000]
MPVASPEQVQLEIEGGMGGWSSVSPCIRRALVLVLSKIANKNSPSPRPRSRSRGRRSIDPRPRVLLPLRKGKPEAELVNAVDHSRMSYERLKWFEREMHRSTDDFATFLLAQKAHASHQDNEGACSRCGGQLSRKGACDGKHTKENRSTRRADSDKSSSEHESPNELQASQKPLGRGRTVRPVDMSGPKVKRVECVRHRKEVSAMLVRLVNVIIGVGEDVQNTLLKELSDAMRMDVRRAREMKDGVVPRSSPSEEQSSALNEFAKAIDSLIEASRELVASFFTSEEKLFLGIDTHRYQTRKERATTYQYLEKKSKKHNQSSANGGDGDQEDAAKETQEEQHNPENNAPKAES